MLTAYRKYKTFECDDINLVTKGSDLCDVNSYLQPGVNRAAAPEGFGDVPRTGAAASAVLGLWYVRAGRAPATADAGARLHLHVCAITVCFPLERDRPLYQKIPTMYRALERWPAWSSAYDMFELDALLVLWMLVLASTYMLTPLQFVDARPRYTFDWDSVKAKVCYGGRTRNDLKCHPLVEVSTELYDSMIATLKPAKCVVDVTVPVLVPVALCTVFALSEFQTRKTLLQRRVC
ncbi:hypothetical protein EVAR_2404_1 [Eumeta japonica]|uniref:Uncharacterized protein n=1 Tax=Eumeta variegata TaxID=151549 RepID=A0A4C1SNC4_EUMVA|nr:hypothetical protein EVAR_2404_1 [Eumeta japonica]